MTQATPPPARFCRGPKRGASRPMATHTKQGGQHQVHARDLPQTPTGGACQPGIDGLCAVEHDAAQLGLVDLLERAFDQCSRGLLPRARPSPARQPGLSTGSQSLLTSSGGRSSMHQVVRLTHHVDGRWPCGSSAARDSAFGDWPADGHDLEVGQERVAVCGLQRLAADRGSRAGLGAGSSSKSLGHRRALHVGLDQQDLALGEVLRECSRPSPSADRRASLRR